MRILTLRYCVSCNHYRGKLTRDSYGLTLASLSLLGFGSDSVRKLVASVALARWTHRRLDEAGLLAT